MTEVVVHPYTESTEHSQGCDMSACGPCLHQKVRCSWQVLKSRLLSSRSVTMACAPSAVERAMRQNILREPIWTRKLRADEGSSSSSSSVGRSVKDSPIDSCASSQTSETSPSSNVLLQSPRSYERIWLNM